MGRLFLSRRVACGPQLDRHPRDADERFDRFAIRFAAVNIKHRDALAACDQGNRKHSARVAEIQRVEELAIARMARRGGRSRIHGLSEHSVGRYGKMYLANGVLGRLIGTKDLPPDKMLVLDDEERTARGKLLGVLDERL